ncbi:MAG: hypothetical protein WBA77_13555 [Microcoleaceae cyanobacterium]
MSLSPRYITQKAIKKMTTLMALTSYGWEVLHFKWVAKIIFSMVYIIPQWVMLMRPNSSLFKQQIQDISD